jgi:hypothetical protein
MVTLRFTRRGGQIFILRTLIWGTRGVKGKGPIVRSVWPPPLRKGRARMGHPRRWLCVRVKRRPPADSLTFTRTGVSALHKQKRPRSCERGFWFAAGISRTGVSALHGLVHAATSRKAREVGHPGYLVSTFGNSRVILAALKWPTRRGSIIGRGVGSRDHASTHQSSAPGSHSTRPSRSPDLCRQRSHEPDSYRTS